MTNLWILKTDDAVKSGTVIELVVRATSEKEARMIAEVNFGDDNWWLERMWARCYELKSDGKKEVIIVRRKQ